jgi:hypothetical protein
MTLDAFMQSLNQERPPVELTPPLKSLWWDRKGDWHQAHGYVQDGIDAPSAWVHAYLHRVEGDLGNASYWYSRAGRTAPDCDLDREWLMIARSLIEGAS